ncbi:hypothetical protein ABT364_06190 [Massilia sp. SR12]
MDCKTTERITFEQRLFAREALAQRWPALDKYICSAGSLEAAYGHASRALEGKLDIPRGAAEEALHFYNAVVHDGRYIEHMLEKPQEVASKLELQLSDDVLKHLVSVHDFLSPGSTKMNIAVVAVAVAVTVVIVKGSDPLEEIVIDQSGILKM